MLVCSRGIVGNGGQALNSSYQRKAARTGRGQSAPQIGVRCVDRRPEGNAFSRYFDETGRGVALLGPDNNLVLANNLAQEILQPYIEARGRLRLPNEIAELKLQELVRAVATGGGEAVLPPPVTLELPAGGLTFDALSLPSWIRTSYPAAVAAVVVRSYSASGANPGDSLRHDYALTPSEIRVTRGILHGSSVSEIASEHSLSVGTVRQQLKSVFRKTGVNSQSQLVALLYKNTAYL